MSHDPIRYGDEYQCAKCGKAWSVDDFGEDIPKCTEIIKISLKNISDPHKILMLESQIRGLIEMFGEYGGEDDERLHWTSEQWHTYMSYKLTR